ncbi:MAG TPA: hypothetical protein VJK06_08980, partial [Methyloceanibacter sp.]|nr:hypothetical protein [Methyloceanibacter sp.]
MRNASVGVLIAVLALSAVFGALPVKWAFAQDGLQPGDAYVTRFSGSVTQEGRTVIDTNGTVGGVIDIRMPGEAPRGAYWSDTPQRLEVTAGKVGQVFGVALDDASPPNVYLTATSAFGLHRTPDNQDWMAGMWGPDGGPGTIWKLSAADNYQSEIFARITLDGRANTGAALGNIAFDPWNKQLYVSDLETGMLHRLSLDGADMGQFDHGTTGRANFIDAVMGTQNSLPAVAFDPDSAAKIRDCPAGDFSKEPECWNLADFRRRVWGLGVRRDPYNGEVRLYYSVWGSQGFENPDWETAGDDQRNSVWSVRIGPDGSFDTSNVRREFILPNFFTDPSQIASLGASNPVADIVFPKFGDQDVMLLAERGGIRNLGLDAEAPFARPHESRVLRYELDEFGVWLPAGRYDVGFYDRKTDGQPYLRANASGGVDFGFGYSAAWDADQDKPDQFVWMTGDNLCSPEGPCFDPAAGSATDKTPVDGVQGTPADLANELAPDAAFQPYPATGYATPDATPAGSFIVDVSSGAPGGNDATRIGDVAVYQSRPEGVAEGWMPPGWTPPGFIAPPDYVPPSGWVDWPGWTDYPTFVTAGADLEVKKSAPVDNKCPPSAKCKFEITITNAGTQAYVGPLNIADTLPKGWKLASASAPWTCWQQGNTFSCNHPQTTLATGQSVKLEVELEPPGAASGQPAQMQVDNCAEIDWKGGAGDDNKGNDKGCVTVTFAAAALDLELKK